MGSSTGYACDTVDPYNAWLARVAVLDFNTVFVENSDRFPFEDFAEAFDPMQYMCLKVVFSPSDLGVPLFRNRTYGVAINLSDLVWLGPTTEHGIQAEFMEIFKARTDIDAGVVLGQDSPEEYNALLEHLARRRGYYLNVGSLPLSALLPPSTADTWGFLQQAFSKGELADRMSPSGTVCADISHLEERLRAGAWMPSPCKTSLMASVTKNRLFTFREIDSLMGWPSLPHAQCRPYQQCVPSAYWTASMQHRQQFLGNSMSLQQIAAFQLYVYSSVIRRETVCKMFPSLMWRSPPCSEKKPDERKDGAAKDEK